MAGGSQPIGGDTILIVIAEDDLAALPAGAIPVGRALLAAEGALTILILRAGSGLTPEVRIIQTAVDLIATAAELVAEFTLAV
jgi:hypothetical protein